MNKLFSVIFLLTIVTGCGQGKSDQVVTIKTKYGDMTAILYDETPLHKANFIKLIESKFYDSLLFHRVMEGFMIQGGDPDSKNAKPGQNLGSGGPGYTVPAEINSKFMHEKGALSAARWPDAQNPAKASSGSQFYIVHGTVLKQADIDGLKFNQAKLMACLGQMYQGGQYPALFDSLNKMYTAGDMQVYQAKLFSLVPRIEKATGVKILKDMNTANTAIYTTVGGAPHLDGEYTVFGKIIKGLEVIDKIAAVQKGAGNRPVEDIKMSMTAEEMSKKKITKEFGWKY